MGGKSKAYFIFFCFRPAYKRINAVHFDKDSTHIVAADKFGDVYRCNCFLFMHEKNMILADTVCI